MPAVHAHRPEQVEDSKQFVCTSWEETRLCYVVTRSRWRAFGRGTSARRICESGARRPHTDPQSRILCSFNCFLLLMPAVGRYLMQPSTPRAQDTCSFELRCTVGLECTLDLCCTFDVRCGDYLQGLRRLDNTSLTCSKQFEFHGTPHAHLFRGHGTGKHAT